jgi:uncharacterized protein YfiM (DUF2279 family)
MVWFLLFLTTVLPTPQSTSLPPKAIHQYFQTKSEPLIQLYYPASITSKFNIEQNCSAQCESINMVPDRWFAVDKIYHFAVSFSLVGSTYHLLANRIGIRKSYSTAETFAIVFGLGVTKELYDASLPYEHFSYRDLIFDVLGIGLGYLVFIR